MSRTDVEPRYQSRGELIVAINHIESKIEELIDHLHTGQIVHVSTAKLPVAEIDDDGRDTIYDPVLSVEPIREEGRAAFSTYLNNLGFLYKSTQYSSIAARRVAGIVHLKGDSVFQSRARELVSYINSIKDDFSYSLSALYPTNYLRQEFYAQVKAGVIVKTVTRHIPIAKPQLENVTFSWLAKGYQLDRLTHKAALKIAHARCQSKVNNNPNLNLNELIALDEKRLSGCEASGVFWVRPSKINPRYKCSYPNAEGKVKQEAPSRVSLPLLVVTPEPLKRYNELKDYQGVDLLAKVKGTQRVSRVPVIEEYGFYLPYETEPSISTALSSSKLEKN